MNVLQKISAAGEAMEAKQLKDAGAVITRKSAKKGYKPFFHLNGHLLTKIGEIATISAQPGSGKTFSCEAIATAYIAAMHGTSTPDTLGFNFLNVSPQKKLLFLDTERTEDENIDSFQRIDRRLGINNDPAHPLYHATEIPGLIHVSTAHFTTTTQLQECIEYYTETHQIGCIILDGILDLVRDFNDLGHCFDTVKYLDSFAKKNMLGIITTIHPNKGTDTVAGHLGSMLYRYCRALFYIKNDTQTPDIKLITADGINGKASHCNASDVFSPITWDSEAHMFMTCHDYVPDVPRKGGPSYNVAAARQVLASWTIKTGENEIPPGEFYRGYSEIVGISEERARKHVSQLVKDMVLLDNGLATNQRRLRTNDEFKLP